MHIHFLTCQELPELNEDDKFLVDKLKLKYSVAPWQEDIPEQTSIVIIRSCWDYFHQHERFIDRLSTIKCPLFNPLETIKWNHDKIYLKEFPEIVPTSFDGTFNLDSEYVIIKPRISNNSNNIRKIKRSEFVPQTDGFLIQPFLNGILEGEYSVVVFNNKISHCVLKTPAKNDFRVQHTHGGSYTPVTPSESLRTQAESVIKRLPDHLYARLDFILDNGNYYLSEVEMIEPYLHFVIDGACENFMKALMEKT